MTESSWSWPRLSRRTLLASTTAGVALAPLVPFRHALAGSVAPTAARALVAQEAGASPATWRTWVLSSASELRPEAPAEPTQDELAELIQMQADRDDVMTALIQQWNSRPAVLVWTDLANAAYPEFKISALRQYRANALLQTAMADAVLATYDAQDAYAAPLPANLDAQISPLAGLVAGRPAFPSEHAAVAGAAAAVLTALLPGAAPARFTDLATQAATTRLQAGLNTRHDIEAGLALGKAIGEKAIALAADDQPGSAWDGSGRLEGPGYWAPTPPAFVETPLEPLAATWHRWVLESADQFRPAPPPAYDSSAWRSQVAAVQEAAARRTLIQAEKALYWQNSAASTLWDHYASDLITRYRLDLPHAARVLALTAVAVADAGVACWDGKYTYWVARPITVAPEVDVLFPTPPFPSYPSAHPTVSSAAAVVLAHLFPDDAADVFALAEEASASRAWAGIHYPVDNDAGMLLGRQVGYLVADVARHDGAE
jgi:membrane-associated phospholipid phosphatase